MDDNCFVLKCSRIQFSTFTFECYSVLPHTNKNAASCHIWLLKRNFIQILKKDGGGHVGVTGAIEMKWQRNTLQNERKSSFYIFFFFPVFPSILSNEVRLVFVCAMTKRKLKVTLLVKLRAGIPTLITSWGMHELVSLSLEMELWQRPPITAINVLKFCSWWSFCVDIQKISIYYLQAHVVQYAHPNSTFPLLSPSKVLKVSCHYPFDFIHFGTQLWFYWM